LHEKRIIPVWTQNTDDPSRQNLTRSISFLDQLIAPFTSFKTRFHDYRSMDLGRKLESQKAMPSHTRATIHQLAQ